MSREHQSEANVKHQAEQHSPGLNDLHRITGQRFSGGAAHGADRLVAGQPATVLWYVVAIPVYAVRGGLGTGRGSWRPRVRCRACRVPGEVMTGSGTQHVGRVGKLGPAEVLSERIGGR